MERVSLLMVASLAAMMFALNGCGSQEDIPQLGNVHGTVTMNGRPISGVLVVFQPDSGARHAVAKVGDDGGYTAQFFPDHAEAKESVEGIDGVPVGPCTVRVNQIMGARLRGKIPDKYAAQSELKLEVVPGDNTFDIAMESR